MATIDSSTKVCYNAGTHCEHVAHISVAASKGGRGDMLTNESIKILRKQKGLTLEELAKRTGFTKGYLSKIERSDKQPPFATLQVIATALDTTLQDLLSFVEPQTLERSPETPPHPVVHKTKLVLNNYQTYCMAPFVLTLGKGETEVLVHSDEEFVYVLSGEMQLRAGEQLVDMCAGDSYYLESNVPHSYINHTDALCVTLNVKSNNKHK